MTIIVGVNWLTEFVMIADTRISWPTDKRHPQDILKKLYTITDNNKSAILGFSGSIATARTILQHLKEEKFRNLKRKFVIENFKDNLRGWIEDITMREIPTSSWGNVTFMLGGVEPLRHTKLVEGNKIIGIFPELPEIHIYVYYTNKDTGKVTVVRKSPFAIIGSGKVLESDIQIRFARVASFASDEPRLHWTRSVVFTDMVAALCRRKGETTIGGPFQAIRITNFGMEQHYIWPADDQHSNVDVLEDLKSTIIYHPDLKTSYTIYPVWEL